ncbi:MAG: electron transfer flavoprotein subunit alpha/FixB family protein [Vicinamibacterales bacterium]
MILVIAEHQNSTLNRATWETIAAAQQMPGRLPVRVAVLGDPSGAVAAEVAAADVAEIILVDNPALARYTADGFTQAVVGLVERLSPAWVMLPHTYRTRDFAPKAASRLRRALIPDCIGSREVAGSTALTRLMFQGKLAADVVPEGDRPWFATIQIAAFRADSVVRASAPAPIVKVDVPIEAGSVRQVPDEPFREARQAVDLSQAERIVAVGRGIKAKENLDLAMKLAEALGAEVGASRPICDAGWLPMERQIGSSGQTVAPKLYFALGISGAIQHLVGMKGARTIVAVNKDPDAPIFEVADFGIVGDIFEVVPAVIQELNR